ncbi:hypothetical protein D5R81_18940 [Parashewanella spongiae]|uniref:Uncharacterized protein n=1 Tax=Parashewanella spongiae TaxID=342950 RepID=A0A3A6TJG3_9GAMM|nr:hypothetical protein [Parashewanella spongiae]MCL1080108.1 hypothetical protein [Parashewanella spongiae]RJY04928.1 hypothetical protein D5R81_18940 [Parashewanella spongiae]
MACSLLCNFKNSTVDSSLRSGTSCYIQPADVSREKVTIRSKCFTYHFPLSTSILHGLTFSESEYQSLTGVPFERKLVTSAFVTAYIYDPYCINKDNIGSIPIAGNKIFNGCDSRHKPTMHKFIPDGNSLEAHWHFEVDEHTQWGLIEVLLKFFSGQKTETNKVILERIKQCPVTLKEFDYPVIATYSDKSKVENFVAKKLQ